MPSYRYPGPRPFEENDINLFFGREKDKRNLLTFINVEPLLVVFSKSGLGKSSLINAAIIPELRKKNYEIIVCRFNSYVNKERNENDSYEQQSPLQKLYTEVTSKQTATSTFLDKLVTNPEQLSLWHQFKNLQISNTEKKTYFIFFDQFEELFTYPPQQVKEFKEHLAELLNASIPQEYLDQINQLEDDTESASLTDKELGLLYDPIPVKMLCTIRSDKFSLLTSLKDAIPGIVTKTYELKPFSTPEAMEAIIKPALLENDIQGNSFISNAFSYDDDALKRMLTYLTDSDTEDIESFQLQVLCRYVEDIVVENSKGDSELKNITANQLGDIKNIFEEYYNKLIAGIDKDKVNNVRKLFEEGLIFEKDKIRVPLYKGQITDSYGVDDVLLAKLVNTHLIRSEQDTNGKEKFELSHDSLIDPILKAKEKRMAEERATLQRTNFRKNAILLAKRIGIAVVLIILIMTYFFIRTAKRDKQEINFLVKERDWFYLLDSTQRLNAMKNNFLALINKDSSKYNTLRYSFKCAAYANQNEDNNYSLALRFAQEGYLKDSNNTVINESFNRLIRKPNVFIPSEKIHSRGVINNVFVSKDQQTIITATSHGIYRYKNGSVTDSLIGYSYESNHSAFSDDGSYLVYEYDYDTIHLLNLTTKQLTIIKDVSSDENVLGIAHNNEFIIYGDADTLIEVALDGSIIKKYPLPISKDDIVNCVSISAHNNYLAAGTYNGEVFFADLNKSNAFLLKPANKSLHTETVNAISFSLDEKYILSCSDDGKAQVWDIKESNLFQTIYNAAPILTCAFSNDDSDIITGEKNSGNITRWSLRKQNSLSGKQVTNRSIQTASLQYGKDSFKLYGLDSAITFVDFYGDNSKIIAASNKEISIWNLNAGKKLPLKISQVIAMNLIPQFSVGDKIKWNLIAEQDLLALTNCHELYESIKFLNDSLDILNAKTDGIKNYRQTFIKITGLIPRLFSNISNCKENNLAKLDSFDLYIYTGNSYFYKILLDEDSLNGNFSRYNLNKLIQFRQAPFKLDTMYKKCFNDLFSAYAIAISYYYKNNQYNVALYWNDKILKDNRQIKNIEEIKDALTVVNLYDVSFRILKGDIQGAKTALQNWPDHVQNLDYVLTKELVDVYTNPNYTFNQNTFKDLIKNYDVTDTDNKQILSDMDDILITLIDSKTLPALNETVAGNLVKFDNYIYPLVK